MLDLRLSVDNICGPRKTTPTPHIIAEDRPEGMKYFSSNNGMEEEIVFPVNSRSAMNLSLQSGNLREIELTIAALPW